MKAEELKGVEHVSVTENESGMVTVKMDEGYCLKTTVMVEKTAEPTEMPMERPEGDAEIATVADETEPVMVEETSYARVIYCRKETELPDYEVVVDSEEPTEDYSDEESN